MENIKNGRHYGRPHQNEQVIYHEENFSQPQLGGRLNFKIDPGLNKNHLLYLFDILISEKTLLDELQ